MFVHMWHKCDCHGGRINIMAVKKMNEAGGRTVHNISEYQVHTCWHVVSESKAGRAKCVTRKMVYRAENVEQLQESGELIQNCNQDGADMGFETIRWWWRQQWGTSNLKKVQNGGRQTQLKARISSIQQTPNTTKTQGHYNGKKREQGK